MIKLGKKRNGFVISMIACMVLFSIVFSGCASQTSKFSDSNSLGSVNHAPDYEYSGDMEQSVTEVAGTANKAVAVRKIIQTAHIDLETEDTLTLYQKLASWVQSNGGYEFSKNQYKSGDATVMEATLKLPPDKLNVFLDFAAQSGMVVNSSVDAQDITDSYYDVQTRLASKRKSLEQYYELLKNTQTVEEIVTVQQSINQLTEEIEALEGSLKLWDSQIDYSDIHVFIREYSDLVKIKKDFNWNTMSFDDMLYMMKQGFLSVVNTVASCLQWIAIILVSASPILLPLLAVVLLLIYITKYKKKKSNGKKHEAPKDKPE